MLLEYLKLRAIPGVEQVDGSLYRRSISLAGQHGWFEVALDARGSALEARIQFTDPRALFQIVERIRNLFDLNADWQSIAAGLTKDRELSARLGKAPGLRVPGCWDGFELAIRAILGQQVTVKGATTLAGRIVRANGRKLLSPHGLTHLFPTPEVMAAADLSAVGLPGTRAATIRALARAVADGELKFEGVIDTEAFRTRLCEIPGIGKWTAQYVAMRALRDPDAFPAGDLGLIRGLNAASERDLERRSEAWRPWRAYAAMYVWNVDAMHRENEDSGIAHTERVDRTEQTV
jgi:AraC family transcriptional regulator, regulatory protein of adaptative response / DNA-3-methyladenine glycosylase II